MSRAIVHTVFCAAVVLTCITTSYGLPIWRVRLPNIPIPQFPGFPVPGMRHQIPQIPAVETTMVPTTPSTLITTPQEKTLLGNQECKPGQASGGDGGCVPSKNVDIGL